VAEEITAALSRMRSLIVIARSSTQRYRGQPVDLAQVARELNVRYVVLGSVRRAAGAVRISARLVEAATGTQSWASHYDRKLDHVFALEDRTAFRSTPATHVCGWRVPPCGSTTRIRTCSRWSAR
jgi:adenylate cyclase